MKEACRAVGMTYEALKFYCNEGLVPNVKRDQNNRRIFNERDIKWIKGLTCLKDCGMSIQEMKVYLALCLQGEASIPARKVILAQKREDVNTIFAISQDGKNFRTYVEGKSQRSK
jgi:DNA-binding transcriptional MerR regulator